MSNSKESIFWYQRKMPETWSTDQNPELLKQPVLCMNIFTLESPSSQPLQSPVNHMTQTTCKDQLHKMQSQSQYQDYQESMQEQDKKEARKYYFYLTPQYIYFKEFAQGHVLAWLDLQFIRVSYTIRLMEAPHRRTSAYTDTQQMYSTNVQAPLAQTLIGNNYQEMSYNEYQQSYMAQFQQSNQKSLINNRLSLSTYAQQNYHYSQSNQRNSQFFNQQNSQQQSTKTQQNQLIQQQTQNQTNTQNQIMIPSTSTLQVLQGGQRPESYNSLVQINASRVFQIQIHLMNQVITISSTSHEDFMEWQKQMNKVVIRTDFHQNYQVVSQLGKGSFARVFKAKRFSDQKNFAVKAFSKTHIIKRSCAPSLQREVEILKDLNHPYFLGLEEVHETENSVYLVMQLVKGEALLKKMIKQRAPTKEKNIIYILRSLFSALAILADNHIMHRDLKPDNILWKYCGMSPKYNQVVLIDFGLAQDCRDEEYLHKRCGTPGFVAPEVLTQDLNQRACYSPKVDVFAAGVLLYQMLTGSLPFSGKDVDTVIRKNKAGKVDFDKLEIKVARASCQHLLKTLLQPNPDKRITARQALEHPYVKEVDYIPPLERIRFIQNNNKSNNQSINKIKNGIQKKVTSNNEQENHLDEYCFDYPIKNTMRNVLIKNHKRKSLNSQNSSKIRRPNVQQYKIQIHEDENNSKSFKISKSISKSRKSDNEDQDICKNLELMLDPMDPLQMAVNLRSDNPNINGSQDYLSQSNLYNPVPIADSRLFSFNNLNNQVSEFSIQSLAALDKRGSQHTNQLYKKALMQGSIKESDSVVFDQLKERERRLSGNHSPDNIKSLYSQSQYSQSEKNSEQDSPPNRRGQQIYQGQNGVRNHRNGSLQKYGLGQQQQQLGQQGSKSGKGEISQGRRSGRSSGSNFGEVASMNKELNNRNRSKFAMN